MEKVYIGMGGNLGDAEGAMRKALKLVEEEGLGRVIRVSSFYRTEPVGIKDQPWFVNAAAEMETELAPEQLRAGLGRIEARLGREKERVKDGPRPIDLDILLFGDRVIRSAELTVPHPRMHERRFVLAPLAEIAAGAVHPVLGRTAGELLQGLADFSRVEKIV
jgi:2-amino-4-hydroxy-6-hydroxymethyldihydropteridine diphosphokinase